MNSSGNYQLLPFELEDYKERLKESDFLASIENDILSYEIRVKENEMENYFSPKEFNSSLEKYKQNIEEYRFHISNFFVRSYIIVISTFFIFAFINNWVIACNNHGREIEISFKDLILALSSPLSFIIGYYFKEGK